MRLGEGTSPRFFWGGREGRWLRTPEFNLGAPVVFVGRQAVEQTRPAVAHGDAFCFRGSVRYQEMVVAEVRYGVREDVCAHCGWAADVVVSLMAAVCRGGGYEEGEDGEEGEEHGSGGFWGSWVGEEGSRACEEVLLTCFGITLESECGPLDSYLGGYRYTFIIYEMVVHGFEFHTNLRERHLYHFCNNFLP